MSRRGGGRDDLAYGDIPQRWDRDRFERFSGQGPPPGPPPSGRRYEEDYQFQERDRPGHRDVAVADRIDERGPNGRFQETDRYYEHATFNRAPAPAPAPPGPRRRTDRELFGDVDPREIAEMALQPYRRQSISRDDEYARLPPPRPGLLRRQSSLDTFDRRPAPRPQREEYRPPANVPIPLPIRRPEPIQEYYQDHAPEDYREVEITRERSVHRRRPPKSSAPSRVSRAKSVTTRRTSPSGASSESYEESEYEKAESIRESIAETQRKVKKGKTRMPKRLVRREAIMDLGYPFDEEDDFFVLRTALEKEQIDEVMKISESYKDGGIKKVYRFEEKVTEERSYSPPPVEREEVVRTEWVNPPTVVMTGARSERAKSTRAPSPSSHSSISGRMSPARTMAPSVHTRARSRRPSSPGTYVEERRTVIEDRGPPTPSFPPPSVYPVPPAPVYYEDQRTIIQERGPAPSIHQSGALIIQEREPLRSDRDINHEIRSLEAERRALRLEREAEEKRDMALRLREGRREEEYQMVEYRDARPREREVLEIVDRERSPSRNVVRVEKDRKERRRKKKIVAAAVATLL